MRVYHFVNTVYGISNLSLRRLKVSRFNQLNDPFELLAADLLDKRDRTAFTKFKCELDDSTGMICFSRSWSNPLLWGHYAERHTGMALGFDIPDENLCEVDYTTQRAKVAFDLKTRKVVDGKKVIDRLIRTKFTDWQYEAEYRMFVDLSSATKEGSNYFQDFSAKLVLKQVILGLNCDLPIHRVHDLCKHEMQPVHVFKAGMHLRKFKIIEDRSARLTPKST